MIVIPWETVSQPISTTTTADCLPACLPGLTSSDCACLGSLLVRLSPSPSPFLARTRLSDCLTARLKSCARLWLSGSQASTCLPSITRCLHFNSFVCGRGDQSQSGPARPAWSVLVLSCLWLQLRFAFAMCLRLRLHPCSSLWHADNCGIVIAQHFIFSPSLSFACSSSVCVCIFFNALWIIDWDRGLRGPSITLFVYMIILDCPL